MPDKRKQIFLAKPRPDQTAEQFADRVLGQLTEAGILGEDGKIAPEVRELGRRKRGQRDAPGGSDPSP